MNRCEVYKETTDDWCPNFHGNLVEVTFHGNITRPKQDIPVYRVSVWGNDDLGMEFDTEDEKTALTIFMQVIGLKYVTFVDLKQLGFVPS